MCGAGYEGRACGACAYAHYQDGALCSPCKQDADKNEQYLQVFLVGCLFLIFCFGLVLLERKTLDKAAAALVVFQQLLISMKSAQHSIQDSNALWLQSMYRTLQLFRSVGLLGLL